MTEAQIGFLYNIAATISKSQNDVNNTILKSYYLMRCKDITRGYGLPDKHFSSKVRCPNCCLEWNNKTEVNVKSIKLTKRQKHRLKSKRVTHSKKESVRSRKDLLISNELEQICSFCKNRSVTNVPKPQKQAPAPPPNRQSCEIIPEDTDKNKIVKLEHKNLKSKTNKTAVTNVYANALDIFSLQNKKNTLLSTIKEKPKVINNNKRRKDKFAGLCQKAVLASAKIKEQKNKSNALNMFLKPSST